MALMSTMVPFWLYPLSLKVEILEKVLWSVCLSATIITESFNPLDLSYTTSSVKFWIRSDMTGHAIPDTVYLLLTDIP